MDNPVPPLSDSELIASRARAQQDLKRLGQSIRTILRAMRKRPAWLAEEVGISVQVIYAIQRGRQWPRMPVYIAICRALKVRLPPLI